MSECSPITIDFVPGSWLVRGAGTCVVLPDGSRVPIPGDQVVFGDDSRGAARIGLGGMSFEGMEESRLVFWRVKDLLPEELLPSDRGDKLTLDPVMVSSVQLQGVQVWPRAGAASTA